MRTRSLAPQPVPARSLPLAWGGLEELRPIVRKRLKPACRDEHEVDDLVQETLLRAARYRASLSDPTKLQSWLLRIARNVHRDHLRRERRYRSSESGDELFALVEGREEAPGTERGAALFELDRAPLERDEAEAHVVRALSALRVSDRALIESFYHRGEGVRGAAECIAVPVHRIKVRLFRARQRLRREVGRSVARERTAVLMAQEVRA